MVGLSEVLLGRGGGGDWVFSATKTGVLGGFPFGYSDLFSGKNQGFLLYTAPNLPFSGTGAPCFHWEESLALRVHCVQNHPPHMYIRCKALYQEAITAFVEDPRLVSFHYSSLAGGDMPGNMSTEVGMYSYYHQLITNTGPSH